MGFHPEGVGAGRTPEGNREANRRHVANGTVHQTLVYQRGAYLHTGPETLFEVFGFVRDRRIGKWRWVMRLDLTA